MKGNKKYRETKVKKNEDRIDINKTKNIIDVDDRGPTFVEYIELCGCQLLCVLHDIIVRTDENKKCSEIKLNIVKLNKIK